MGRYLTLTNFLLFSIGVILLIGLFTTEQDKRLLKFKIQNFFKFEYTDRTVPYTTNCTEWKETLEYKEAKENCSLIGDAKKDFLDLDRVLEIDKCIKNIPVDRYKVISNPCTQTKKEVWFYALGRYWFKKP